MTTPMTTPTIAPRSRFAAPIASVILPAHDEAEGILTTLAALTGDARPGELEIVVVCNGCSDDTAALAATVPGVRVEEIETPSKLAALRAGDRIAQTFPRIYLDADIPLPTDTVRALAEALGEPGTLVAGVPGEMDLSDSGGLVSLFYEFRDHLPVFAAGGVGAGVYAMSAEGRARFDDWPDLRSGDDQFVRRLFEPHERATLSDHATRITPPPDLRAVIRRGVRTRKGNAALSAGAAGRDLDPPPAGRMTAVRSAVRTPRGIAATCVFVAVTALVRLKVRFGGGDDWVATTNAAAGRTGDVAAEGDRAPARQERGALRPAGAVIVTFNAAAHVPELLRSLRTAMGDEPAPVVVVDNDSTDQTTTLVAQESGVQLLTQPNIGFAAGVNRGVAALPADHDVLMLNPDTRLRPDVLDRLRRVLSDDPTVGIAVPRLTDTDGHSHRSMRRDPGIVRNLVEALVGGTRAGRLGESYRLPPSAPPTEVDWATGAFMLVRREAMDAVGGLDESFFLYSEETDLCRRIRDRGYRVVADPAAVVEHVGGDMSRHPGLWALRAVNRVRRYRRSAGRLRGLGFWASQLLFELRRAATGDQVSRAAVRALCSRDLDASARRLVTRLGGDTSRL